MKSDNEIQNFGLRNLLFDLVEFFCSHLYRILKINPSLVKRFFKQFSAMVLRDTKAHLGNLEIVKDSAKLWVLTYLEFEFLMLFLHKQKEKNETLRAIR